MSIVYFKFRAQIAYETVLFNGHFVSVGELKRLICQKKSMGDAVAELVLSNPKTNEEYSNDSIQIAKGTHVLIRRVPAQQKARVLVGTTPVPQLPGAAKVPSIPGMAVPAVPGSSNAAPASSGAPAAAGPAPPAAASGDEFGADPFAASAANLAQEQAAARNLAMVASAAAGAMSLPGARPSWGGPGRGGASGGRGGGRGRGPGPTYVCRRCSEAGKHWEKECPTIGDPAFDFKVIRNPTGIPVTKLSSSADGSLILPSGEAGELAPNQTAFQKQVALMTGAAFNDRGQSSDLTPHALIAKQLGLPAPQIAPPADVPKASQQQQQQQQEEEKLALPAPLAPDTAHAAMPDRTSQATHADPDAETAPPGHGHTAAEPQEVPAAAEPKTDQMGLFDDDDVDHSAAPVLISTAPAASEPDAAALADAAIESAELDEIPEDLRKPFCTRDELRNYRTQLRNVLPPRTTMQHCMEAYGGRALTPAEFEKLQKDILRSARPRSRSRSPPRAVARPRAARSRSPPRRSSHRDHSRPHTSARSRSRSPRTGRTARPRSRSPARQDPQKPRGGPARDRSRSRNSDERRTREKEARPTKEAGGSGTHRRERSRTSEEPSRADRSDRDRAERKDDDAAAAETSGRKRLRSGNLEELDRVPVSKRGVSSPERARSAGHAAPSEHESDGGDDKRDRKKSGSSKEHKKHKRHKEKDKSRERSRDRSRDRKDRRRSSSPGSPRIDDRYIPEGFNGGSQNLDADKAASRGSEREGEPERPRDPERFRDRLSKPEGRREDKEKRPPAPGRMFQSTIRSLISSGR